MLQLAPRVCTLINPRRACAARVPSVCLSVTTSSATTRNETTKQRYQRVHRYTGFILKRRFSYNCCVQKLWREKRENKPICKLAQAYLHRVRLLCVPWRHKKSQRRASIDSRMLSTTVASPCQTLRELLAGYHE